MFSISKMSEIAPMRGARFPIVRRFNNDCWNSCSYNNCGKKISWVAVPTTTFVGIAVSTTLVGIAVSTTFVGTAVPTSFVWLVRLIRFDLI